jgi:hypothetical protein
MLDLNVMKDLLVGEILVPLRKEHGKCFAQLKEDAPDSKLRTVRIFDVSPGSILINLDKYQQPRTLLRNEKGQRQRCDYVLLTTWQKQPLMLFVEMKSKVAKDPGIQKQFKGAECVMDYCNVTGDLKVPWNGRPGNVCFSSLVFFQRIRIRCSSVFFPRFLPYSSSS